MLICQIDQRKIKAQFSRFGRQSKDAKYRKNTKMQRIKREKKEAALLRKQQWQGKKMKAS